MEVGACSLQGKKVGFPEWVNQDAHLSMWLSAEVLLLGVFDGHGEKGHHIAARTRQIFEQYAPGLLMSGSSPCCPLSRAYTQLFALTQSVLEREGLSQFSGTTAAVALVDAAAGAVTTAHAGDSRVMVVRDQKVEFETADHSIDEEEERRITACGGDVRELEGNGKVKRIFIPGKGVPGLAMARSLGDVEAHLIGALAEASVSPPMALRPGSVLVLASDGVWDKLSRDYVAANVALSGAEAAARSVAMAARSRWPAEGDIDDITAVVAWALPAPTCDVPAGPGAGVGTGGGSVLMVPHA